MQVRRTLGPAAAVSGHRRRPGRQCRQATRRRAAGGLPRDRRGAAGRRPSPRRLDVPAARGRQGRVAARLRELAVTDANADELIEVAFYEAVDVEHGFGPDAGPSRDLQLDHRAGIRRPSAVQSRPAEGRRPAWCGTSIRNCCPTSSPTSPRQGAAPAASDAAELVAARDWLFGEHSYHIDTTHLAATVRFAEMLTEPSDVRLALDLTEYGRRLNAQFQYPGDEPFAETYPSHALFFGASLGERRGRSAGLLPATRPRPSTPIKSGRCRSKSMSNCSARLRRYDEAIEAAISLMPDNVHPVGFAPSLHGVGPERRPL